MDTKTEEITIAETKSLSEYKALRLQVFHHHIYEYKKGLRNLVLYTDKAVYRPEIEARLEREKVAYTIHEINHEKINVYFGALNCVNVVKSFHTHKLNELSAEQDFILGIMLGYDRLKQCERYLNMFEKAESKLEKTVNEHQ